MTEKQPRDFANIFRAKPKKEIVPGKFSENVIRKQIPSDLLSTYQEVGDEMGVDIVILAKENEKFESISGLKITVLPNRVAVDIKRSKSYRNRYDTIEPFESRVREINENKNSK